MPLSDRRTSLLSVPAWLAPVFGLAFLLPAHAQTAHYAGVQTPLGSGFVDPIAVAVDVRNNVYILDHGESQTVEYVGTLKADVLYLETPSASGYVQTKVFQTFLSSANYGSNAMVAMAADAAGNLYIAEVGLSLDGEKDGSNSLVKLTLTNGSYTSSVISTNVGKPTGVAVTPDGTAIYVADATDNEIFQFAYSSGSYVQQATVNSGVTAPTGVATDSTGAWYVLANGSVYKHAAGFSPAAFSGTTTATGLSSTANAVTLDSANDLFLADTGSNRIVELPSGSTTLSVVASNVSGPKGVGVDSNGVIAIADSGDGVAFTQNPAALNFGSVAVGTTSAAQTLAFVFDTAGSLNATTPYQALLGGVGFLDYAVVAGSGTTCTAGTAFTTGATCTISATFTPAFAGTRNGAILLNGSAGAQAALAYIAGIGSGPQVAFAPVQSTLFSTGLSNPSAVAMDGAGNIYIADFGNSRVLKETLSNGSYVQSSLGSGLLSPSGVAVDGAGNVYIADVGHNRVVKEIYSGGVYTQSPTALGSGLDDPQRVAVDGAGNVYIADSGNSRVVKEIYSGGAYTQSPTALGSGLNNPRGVAVDGAGNVYIADFLNNQVVKETYSSGAYTQSPIALRSVSLPEGVAVDGAGNVYIADTGNSRVVKEIYSGGSYTQSATAVGNGLSSPADLMVDNAGNVYVADSGNNRILLESVSAPTALTFAKTAYGTTSTDSPQTLVVTNLGNLPLTVSSVTVANNFPVDSSGCTAAPVPANGSCSLNYSFTPVSLQPPGGETSVITDNSLNVTSTSNVSLGGQTMAGTQTITFPQPAGSGSFVAGTVIPLNATSSVGATISYQVGFTGGVRPTLSASNGTETLKLGGSGTGTVTVTANAYATSTYNQATPVSVSFQATLVTAPASGAVLTDTAIGSSTSAEVTLQFVTAGTLGSVTGLTQGAPNLDYSATLGANDCVAGTSYVAGQVCTATVTFAPTLAGTCCGAVEVLDGSGNVLGTTLLQANGLGPQVAFPPVQRTLFSGGFINPNGIAVDGRGNVYVADSGQQYGRSTGDIGAVYLETFSNGSYTQGTVGSGLANPGGVTVDGAGNVYIADSINSRVLKETLSGGTYTQSTLGSGLSYPGGVAVDGAGNVYIADSTNSRVLKETLSGGTYIQSTVSSGLQNPGGVAVDGAGNVYIADTNNSRVLKETLSGGTYIQSTVSSGLQNPGGIAVDGAGNVYIADTNNSRVLKETLSGGTYSQSTVGNGLSLPGGVAVDGAGNVYIADSYNNRVLLESVATAPAITFPSTATGATSAPLATTITNLGNQPLVFPVPASGLDPQTAANFSLETNTDTTCPVVNAGGTAGQLAANANCTLSYVFAPTQLGSISGTSVLTDNNLDVSGAFQSVSLSGTATQGTQTAQTILFPQPAGTIYPGSATLGATASSGLAVSYTLVSGPATLSGNILTYTGPGTVVVTANQAGNVQIGPAPPVSISIIVTQATAIINWQPSTLKIYTGTALGANILDATDTIPATISYSAALLPSGSAVAVAATTALTQGSYYLTATFTPQDSVRYAIVSDTLPFTVQNMNVFVSNYSVGKGSVSSLFNNGSVQSAAANGGGTGAAVDAGGSVWSINPDGASLARFTNAGVPAQNYTGIGLSGASALAIDGNSNILVANGNGTVALLSNAGVAVSTAQGSTTVAPAALAIDSAGNVWVANAAANTVDEIVGGAAPASPLAIAVQSGTPGAKP